MIEVEHAENRQSAPEEADRIAEEVARLLDGGRYTDMAGEERALTLEDILVVAPFNAQVRHLRDRLPRGARVGTVDKFQGQEAPVVFFSMTASSGEDVPRGMDFLFSRNRLNVAISRAPRAGRRGLLAPPAVGALQHGRADAAGQRAVLVRRRGRAPGPASSRAAPRPPPSRRRATPRPRAGRRGR